MGVPRYRTHPGRMSQSPRAGASLAALLRAIREARFASGIVCVRCGSRRVIRWGTSAGRQRYRCSHCRRTFNDLTGTPAAYLKRVLLLPAYRGCMAQSLSVRASARAVGVHMTTSFRWRHRFLRAMMGMEVITLRGLVELGEGWVLCSNTVITSMFRTRPRRSLADPEQIRSWIVALADRSGRSILAHTGPARPDRHDWADVLSVVVDPTATVIIRHGRHCEQAIAARALGHGVWHHGSMPRLSANLLLRDTRHARVLLHCCRHWLRRFRGVATHYLDNYLFWHGAIDPVRCTAWPMRRLLCWPVHPQPRA